jgi:hypothetical protein
MQVAANAVTVCLYYERIMYYLSLHPFVGVSVAMFERRMRSQATYAYELLCAAPLEHNVLDGSHKCSQKSCKGVIIKYAKQRTVALGKKRDKNNSSIDGLNTTACTHLVSNTAHQKNQKSAI